MKASSRGGKKLGKGTWCSKAQDHKAFMFGSAVKVTGRQTDADSRSERVRFDPHVACRVEAFNEKQLPTCVRFALATHIPSRCQTWCSKRCHSAQRCPLKPTSLQGQPYSCSSAQSGWTPELCWMLMMFCRCSGFVTRCGPRNEHLTTSWHNHLKGGQTLHTAAAVPALMAESTLSRSLPGSETRQHGAM